MEVLEFLKIRGNKAKVAKAVGVSNAYLSQSIKAGRISKPIEEKIKDYIQKVETPVEG